MQKYIEDFVDKSEEKEEEEVQKEEELLESQSMIGINFRIIFNYFRTRGLN